MVDFKVGKCPKCGRLSEIIFSNNPLLPGLCFTCINKEIDASSLQQADFFCRSYNIPFNPSRWVEIHKKCGKDVFKEYTRQWLDSTDKNLYYSTQTSDKWKKLDEEWQNCRTFEEILDKVEPIKEGFINRSKIKWGGNYTFDEYIQLENLLTSTLKAGDITNPIQIDAIKKACKISVELDRAIQEGDGKAIKDLSTAYASFTKTAQIDEVITTANNDVISTVAELADYIEKCGGQYKFYDNVPRDIVDKTIDDLKNYIRTLVTDATGLDVMLENIMENYKTSVENDAAKAASSKLSLNDIVANFQEAANNDLDNELAADAVEDVNFFGDDDDDD